MSAEGDKNASVKPATSPEEKKLAKNDKNEASNEELNEEDLKLKEELETLVEVLTENKKELYDSALNSLTTLIRTSTSSMTAVPKPLKFIKPHYPQLVKAWESWEQGPLKTRLAGILSVLGMTQGTALHYRLIVDGETEDDSDLEAWGHDYLRHLALEIGNEYHRRLEADESGHPESGDLLSLSLRIVPFFLRHNAETDAVDLLLEVESVERLTDKGFVDSETYQRVCQYLVACGAYLDSETSSAAMQTAYSLYKSNNDMTQALILAIKLDEEDAVRSVFAECHDPSVRKQLALTVARQRRFYNLADEDGNVPEDIADVVNNTQLSSYFLYLAKELNLEKPKLPSEILGSTVDGSAFKAYGERAKINLVSIFCRGFMNAGFCNLGENFDEYISVSSNSRTVCASVHSSIGLGYLWNYNTVLQELDQYIDAHTDNVARAGAILGIGIGTTGVHDETDAPLGILSDFLEDNEETSAVLPSAILSLGFAYAGTSREDLFELLSPFVSDTSLPMEVSSVAALALGLIFVSSANGNLTTTILEACIEHESQDLSNNWAPFMGLGLALLYVGKADKIDAVVEAVKAIEHPISQSLEILLVICAYAGSGNVLQIQRLLCEAATRYYEDEDEDEDDEESSVDASSLVAALNSAASGKINDVSDQDVHMSDVSHDDEGTRDESARTEGENESASATANTSVNANGNENENENANANGEENGENGEKSEEDAATLHESAKVKALCTLGVGLIAMGENIGEEMVLRHLEHLMHYGDSYIRQAVPLAMGLLYTSNPQMKVYETLSRYTHESDFDVAANAIFAMGLVGAGTLNARIAQLLRQLDDYHAPSGDLLFMVRFALGLVNLGKGTQTLSPFSAEKQLLSPVSLAGLLTVSIGLLMPSTKQFILSEHPSLFFSLSLAIQPRMIVTVDEEMKPLKVTVRIGQAVDTVGQAGKPKRITGWVTQDTPVLISAGERAELENDDYEPLSSVLEGIVILRKKTE